VEKILFDKLFKEVFTEQNEIEFMEVLDIVESISPKTIVEIGVKNGGTLNFWRHLVPLDGLVIGIDSVNDIKWDINKDERVRLILGNSMDYKTYKDFRKILGNREVDTLFIDGDHSYLGAKSDFYTYGWHVRKGGLIVIHDNYLDSVGEVKGAVKHFWQELKEKSGKFWEVIYDKHINTGTGIVRRLV